MLSRLVPILFCGIALFSQSAAAGEHPNILILYADDLGFGDLSIQNPKSKIPTPRLDRLASEGIRFTDAHSSSGICTPSRYALLTGRHHWRDFHGIVNAFGDSPFQPERLTLPEMLKARGYDTAVIGKWHLGWNWDAIRKPGAQPDEVKQGKRTRTIWGPEDFDWSLPIPNGPLDHGFDYYFGDTVINFPPYCWIENDRVTQVPDRLMDTGLFKKIKEGNWEFRPGPMVEGWDPYTNIPTTTQKGVEYIREQAESDSPFFLYFAFPSPHAPIIPNDEFDGKSQAGPYGDFVFETDHACGQLLDALEESGQAENTIVIFSADNGPEKYAYARDENFGHWSAEPFRGLKRDIYEGGHHVPFLLRWPGIAEAGRVESALISQVDIMATLAEMVGFKLPDNAAEDSHNLLPLIRGNEKKVRDSHIHNTRDNEYAIRVGEFILIDHKDGYMSGRNQAWEARRDYPADDGGDVELYHFARDPGQRNNIAGNHPDKVKEMKTLLEKIRAQGYSAPRLVD